jgi:hypothetical protein
MVHWHIVNGNIRLVFFRDGRRKNLISVRMTSSALNKFGEYVEKQKLIFICGEAWTGKSTISKILYKKVNNSAWLDGDDVWRVNPWDVEDPRLRNSDINMGFVLGMYLKSKFDYVILSSIVLHDAEIVKRILSNLDYAEYELIDITLICNENEFKKRAFRRDGEKNPHFIFLDETMKRQNTFKIYTDIDNPEIIAEKIRKIIDSNTGEL